MSAPDRSAHPVARGAGGVLVVVIVVNVLPQLLALPDVELPSISLPELPELPAWADSVVRWIHAIVRVKNWLLIAVFVALAVGVAMEQRGRSDPADSDEGTR